MKSCNPNCAEYQARKAFSTPDSIEPVRVCVNTNLGPASERVEELQAKIAESIIARNVEFVEVADSGLCPGPKGLLNRCQNPSK